MRSFKAMIFFAFLLGSQIANADDRSEILSDITKFANDNCAAFESAGYATSTEVKAGIDAGLSGIVRKVFGLGANADAEVAERIKKYKGPIQNQIVENNDRREACRARVRHELFGFFFPKASEEAPKKPPIKAVLCTGEYEGNCPGPHNLFLGCPNRTPQQLTDLFCPTKHGNVSPIKIGISGNNCGYGLFDVTCTE